MFESGFYAGLIIGCVLYVPLFVWHAERLKAAIEREMGKRK
jgi:hypothetical protein